MFAVYRHYSDYEITSKTLLFLTDEQSDADAFCDLADEEKEKVLALPKVSFHAYKDGDAYIKAIRYNDELRRTIQTVDPECYSFSNVDYYWEEVEVRKF